MSKDLISKVLKASNTSQYMANHIAVDFWPDPEAGFETDVWLV